MDHLSKSAKSIKPCIVWHSILSLEKATKGDTSQIIGMTTALAAQGVDASLVALNTGEKKIDGAKVIQVSNGRYVCLRNRALSKILRRLYGTLFNYDRERNARHIARFVTHVLDPVEQYDLYHVRNPHLAIELKKLQPDKPLVYTAISLHFHTGFPKDKVLDQEALNAADNILTLTEGWKQYITDTFDLQGREISVVPVCATNANNVQGTDCLPEHIFKNRKVIGYFGLLQKIRGVDTLIKTIPAVKKAVGNVSVIIAGMSFQNHEEELKALARDLGVYEDIYFVGKIPYSMIPQYLKKCNVLVDLKSGEAHHRRSWHLSVPIKCVEYMVNGKPTVITRDGGTENLLGKNHPYLVEPGDKEQITRKLIKLLTDDEEAVRIGMLNKRISMDYTYEAVANKLINIYSQTRV